MTDIVPTPAAPTVPIYPALGSANFNQEAYAYGSSMPGVSYRIWEIGVAAETNASAARADAIAVADDRVATGLDRVATGQDRVATGQDRVATGQDRQATAADKLQTGLDRVATGQDRVATGQDRVQTGQDRAAAVAARDQAQIYATAQLKATSSTSLTPGTGNKSFTVEPSRSFVAGMYLVATSSGTPADKMSGTVVSYNITTGDLVLSVDKFAGTTARSDWVIGVAAQAADSGQLPYVAVTGTTQAAVTGFLYGLQNAAATTITLPASPANGDMVGIKADNLRLDNVIARNGSLVMGLAENMVIDNPYYPIRLQYQSPYGWRLV